jgi:hypothetical protein
MVARRQRGQNRRAPRFAVLRQQQAQDLGALVLAANGRNEQRGMVAHRQHLVRPARPPVRAQQRRHRAGMAVESKASQWDAPGCQRPRHAGQGVGRLAVGAQQRSGIALPLRRAGLAQQRMIVAQKRRQRGRAARRSDGRQRRRQGERRAAQQRAQRRVRAAAPRRRRRALSVRVRGSARDRRGAAA